MPSHGYETDASCHRLLATVRTAHSFRWRRRGVHQQVIMDLCSCAYLCDTVRGAVCVAAAMASRIVAGATGYLRPVGEPSAVRGLEVASGQCVDGETVARLPRAT